jgi:hypothetical protein
VIEITRFRLRPGVSPAEFAAADARLQTEFAYQQPGLLRRTAALADGPAEGLADGPAEGLADGPAGSGSREGVAVDLWRSAEDADACSARWDGDPVVREWLALIEDGSVTSERFFEFEG